MNQILFKMIQMRACVNRKYLHTKSTEISLNYLICTQEKWMGTSRNRGEFWWCRCTRVQTIVWTWTCSIGNRILGNCWMSWKRSEAGTFTTIGHIQTKSNNFGRSLPLKVKMILFHWNFPKNLFFFQVVNNFRHIVYSASSSWSQEPLYSNVTLYFTRICSAANLIGKQLKQNHNNWSQWHNLITNIFELTYLI